MIMMIFANNQAVVHIKQKLRKERRVFNRPEDMAFDCRKGSIYTVVELLKRCGMGCIVPERMQIFCFHISCFRIFCFQIFCFQLIGMTVPKPGPRPALIIGSNHDQPVAQQIRKIRHYTDTRASMIDADGHQLGFVAGGLDFLSAEVISEKSTQVVIVRIASQSRW
jgi:hypothetical protein